MALVKSSGTSSPRLICAFAILARSVSSSNMARNISPVEICGILYNVANLFASVPLPTPGGPIRIIFMMNTIQKCQRKSLVLHRFLVVQLFELQHLQ